MEEMTEKEGYSKEELAASARFAARKDAVRALLKEGESYTAEETERIIEGFMRRRV